MLCIRVFELGFIQRCWLYSSMLFENLKNGSSGGLLGFFLREFGIVLGFAHCSSILDTP